jgi:predicted transcriptional regulator
MKVKDVMRTQVVTISPKATYEEAARIIHDQQLSGVPVVNDDGKLVGMLSEKNLFRALFPPYEQYIASLGIYRDPDVDEERINEIRENLVEEYMIRKVISVKPEFSIMRVGGLMIARGVHRLPVMQGGKLIGIVSREDIYRAILKHHLKF